MKINSKSLKDIFIKSIKINHFNAKARVVDDNIFLSSYTMLFNRCRLPTPFELIFNKKNLERKKNIKADIAINLDAQDGIISEDEFMDLLPPNTYFH